ncbi:TIGR01777 family oxidoreductase [Bacillus thermotolerans]|uniref:TIGR01777 family oxidoreductase n=1 Tax=Bacillus thermotolerans TaxID=1221996 RepID=UPI00057F50FB|nr:TIGR01777 family oxidoreductase [Bacillus thermotolerans]KKB33734.1 Cell division inhibitor [Bacillus thermotolerans]
MRIVIAGGTGFIGQKLTDALIEAGHEVLILTRKEKAPAGKISYVKWLEESASPESQIGNADVFINLAGVSINNGRWNAAHQKQIYDSRMEATDELLRITSVLPKKPSAFINASAIGIYPSSFSAVYTETSLETAKDFLGKTVHDWEERAKQAESYSNRMAFMRFGVVLGNEGGAFPLMSLPYKFFAGGTVGSGKQWVSWVHITDVVRSILFVIEKENIHGPVNVTSPSPVRMKDFGKTIGAVLHRPHWLPVPSLMMKLALGQKSTLVLEGQHVIPEVLTEEGFQFMFPSLRLALEDLLTKR